MFKKGQVTALVATEVAARGLDIKELPHVVNYELPNVPEDYVHRIGRTGRAGAGGQAISLVSSDESGLLRDIERVLRRSIPTVETPAFKIVESAPAAARPAQGAGRHSQGNRSGNGQSGSQSGGHRTGGHHGGHNGRDSRRSSAGGSRSAGQQRGRYH
jgi:ATP-dependent RNA helicase RhlE